MNGEVIWTRAKKKKKIGNPHNVILFSGNIMIHVTSESVLCIYLIQTYS